MYSKNPLLEALGAGDKPIKTLINSVKKHGLKDAIKRGKVVKGAKRAKSWLNKQNPKLSTHKSYENLYGNSGVRDIRTLSDFDRMYAKDLARHGYGK